MAGKKRGRGRLTRVGRKESVGGGLLRGAEKAGLQGVGGEKGEAGRDARTEDH